MKDIIIDTRGLHIRHVETPVVQEYQCPHCKKEIKPEFILGMVSLVLGDITPREIPELPSQDEKVRIIIQREGKIV